MFLSELNGKRVLNLKDGEIVAIIENGDFTVDEATGEILSLLLPLGGTFRRRFRPSYLTIDWKSVLKIGSEIIVINADLTEDPFL